MASAIEVIIFTGTGSVPVVHGVRTVPLSDGLIMIPVTSDVVRQLDPAVVGDEAIPPDWALKQPVAAFARSISLGRTVLYVVSETFGGQGIKEAIAWTNGQLLFGPAGTCENDADLQPGYRIAHGRDDAVNSGLRAIGVHAGDEHDEYAAAGLTKHRMTDDWLLHLTCRGASATSGWLAEQMRSSSRCPIGRFHAGSGSQPLRGRRRQGRPSGSPVQPQHSSPRMEWCTGSPTSTTHAEGLQRPGVLACTPAALSDLGQRPARIL